MGVGHEKLNNGDTNIFTHSYTHTQAYTNKQKTLGQTRQDSSRFILFHSITDLEQLSSIVGHIG